MCKTFLLVLACLFATNPVYGQTKALEIFKSWDKNGDGILVISEIPEELRRLFARNDLNKDGKITVREHIIAMGRPAPIQRPQTAVEEIRIRQVWEQEPGGWARRVLIRKPVEINSKLPVVIFLHGNGGQADNAITQFRLLSDVIFVCPQGYRRSWNILDEASEAPDVKFITEIIDLLRSRVRDADMENVTLIGSSNGAGMIYRLLIEIDRKPFQKAACLVSSMVEKQYHDGAFWVSSEEGTNRYDQKKRPSRGPRVVYFHGTDDRIVPYYGGNRGNVAHVSAQETAFAFAKAFGYTGAKIPDREAEAIVPGVFKYDYPEAKLTHFKLQGEGHGIARYREFVDTAIRDLIFQ
ncbi:MAG: hypothetical protein CMJ76_10600 [Planctomycetaceae bacterium]|nr:hypothetical protein [Planctomycetaceae bacterium]